MRWLVFGLMVVITPVAFGGDLTPARLYLQRASARHSGSTTRPWRVNRGAIYGACLGAALNVIGALSAPSPPPDFFILTTALAATALVFAGLGACVAQLRNWIVQAK
jgi:hypothetical protein